MNRDFNVSSPLQDPSLGLEEGSSGKVQGSAENPGSSGRVVSPAATGSVNLPAVILSVGFFSVLCLCFGFLAGQELGTPRFLKKTEETGEISQQEQRLTALLRDELLKLKDELKADKGEGERLAAEFRTIGAELKEKLVNTHGLYAGMQDLPMTLGRLEQLILKWEARKVSIVEEMCPATSELPATYPGQVKRHAGS